MTKIKQNTLFDLGHPDMTPITPCDPNVQAQDVQRLSAQCSAILAMLRDGPKTNTQLAAAALKYTSRISDLRKAGYDVRVIERQDNGVVVYGLYN